MLCYMYGLLLPTHEDCAPYASHLLDLCNTQALARFPASTGHGLPTQYQADIAQDLLLCKRPFHRINAEDTLGVTPSTLSAAWLHQDIFALIS